MFTITWACNDFAVWAGEVRLLLSGEARLNHVVVPFTTEQTIINGHIHIEPGALRFEADRKMRQKALRIFNGLDTPSRERLDSEAVRHATAELLVEYLMDSRVMPVPVRLKTANVLKNWRESSQCPFDTISKTAGVPAAVLEDLMNGENHYPLCMNAVIKISKILHIPLSQFCGDSASCEYIGNPDADELCRTLAPGLEDYGVDGMRKLALEGIESFVQRRGYPALQSACHALCECVVHSPSLFKMSASLALRHARTKCGLSIPEVAKATGISAELLLSVEKNDGQYSLQMSHIIALARFLNMDIFELYNLDLQILLDEY